MGRDGQKKNCFVSLTWVRWNVQIFQVILTKVERNVYRNWIVDIKSTKINVHLKEIKTVSNDQKKKKQTTLFIEKSTILVAKLFFFFLKNIFKRLCWGICHCVLVFLDCWYNFAWMNVTSSHFWGFSFLWLKAAISLNDQQFYATLKAMCEDVWR